MQRAKPYVEHIKQEQEICLRDVVRCETPADADSVASTLLLPNQTLRIDAQAQPGFHLGPALDHSRDTHRIQSQESGQIHITRDIT